jgi:hypothetical protein
LIGVYRFAIGDLTCHGGAYNSHFLMTDWFSPDHKPPGPRKGAPGELQWTLTRGPDRAECLFRVTVDIGCEAQLFKNREIVIGQLFRTREQAAAWSDVKRAKLLREGWQPV